MCPVRSLAPSSRCPLCGLCFCGSCWPISPVCCGTAALPTSPIHLQGPIDWTPSLGSPADFLSVDSHEAAAGSLGPSGPLLYSLTALHSEAIPSRNASAQSQQGQPRRASAMPPLPLAAPTPDCSYHVTRSSKATVGLEWLFCGMQVKQRWPLGWKPLHSTKAPNKVRAPAQPTTISPSELLGKREAKLQDREQKSQGNVTSVVISTHAKVPSAFFFLPFEISNSSLWTKSYLSENIDLRPLTKLQSKQS